MSRSSPEILQSISHASDIIKKSQHTVALTGAGISTNSGIPDFRSPGTGLWTLVEPMHVASLSAFRHDPEQFYKWFHPLAVKVFNARPNPAHQALVRLQSAGYLTTIITQNIDGLHSRAGAVNVLEVHGTMDTLSCTNCYRQTPASAIMDDYINHCAIPYCQVCGGILKPDVILYEEQLPVKTWNKAEAACKNCELMVVIGTSLEVMPSAKLPVQAMDHGAHLIILNNADTFMDVRADVVIQADVTEILPQITDEVLKN